MDSLETIYTARLIATQFKSEDLPELYQLHQDPRVMATLGGVRSEAETRRFLQEKMDHWEQYGFGFWMFRDRINDHFVGRGGLQHINIDGKLEIEVGYTVRAEYWGQGFATEMARALVAVGFERLELDSLVCFTLASNHPSQRVMEKAGFVFERNFSHHGQPHVLHRQTR